MICAGFVAASLLPAGAVLADEKADKQELLAANDGFYTALNALFKGEVGGMEQVWSHGDDVNYMGPDGLRLLGWQAVLADWKKQAEKRLGGTIKMDQPQVQVGGSMGVITGIEMGENIIDGKPQKVSIRTTSIFRKEHGKWKMIGHHTDKLAYLQ
jgi:ketosteroid isomerase-like protein